MFFHVVHHLHRIATILKRVSPDCVGEQLAVHRCCICHKSFRSQPAFCQIGDPESSHAYELTGVKA